ncbi:PREDICTED: uncharacterized protein LOC104826362 isoform X2 [Tarenaya hassleriana]|uniref:uncharacterized protein LOC104826362 isoform X2 n=1 Tax=Tarenaya hassleriana TaxID=28532 RepID=UPI00053C39A8|nr:PREDICTED: uncharacterized protein LOC104826362 isoform X2 [Tarenaya hassleriana]
MISVLAQERLLGATLGSALTGFVVFEQRKRIYRSIADRDSQPGIQSQIQVRERIFGKKPRLEIASVWNKAVDQTFGPAIEFLSSQMIKCHIMERTSKYYLTVNHCRWNTSLQEIRGILVKAYLYALSNIYIYNVRAIS